jgi:hypothetical protein
MAENKLFGASPRAAMALCVAIAASVIGAGRMTADTRDVAVRTNAPTVSRASYGTLPLGFERNYGQSDAKVDFLARGRGYSLFLTSNEAVIAVGGGTHADGSRQHALLRMMLVNASRGSRATGADELPGKRHYLIGSDPAKWRTNIPTYGRVTYAGVYPGIDLVYYGNQGQLEYDFIVAPGIDPGLITLAFQGARDVQIDGRGELVLHVEGGEVRQRKPVVYQEIAGVRREVPGVYVLRQANQIGFAIAAYDTSRPLIIDPILVYSTYLGGGGFDHGHDVVVDAAGNAYVTGYAGAVNFPTTPGAAQTTKAGGFSDAFVTKLDPTGSVLLYSTYLGGSDLDYARGIAVDGAGNAYVAGHTASTNFPTTLGAFQTANGGGGLDGFLAKLDPSGSTLVFSTYLGGSNADSSLDIALDGAGSTYVTGSTGSIDFPTTLGAAQATLAGSTDAFVAKLNATGSALVYSTYVGGAAGDFGTSIAVDGSGRAHVAGSSASSDFPATAGAVQTTNAGGNDAFVTTLNATGSVVLSSTYLGGSAADSALGIALDGAGNAYVTGFTASSDFPTTVSAAQTAYAGNRDAFVTKLDATQSARLYSTYLGGAGGDDGNNIAVSSAGSAYVTGVTLSTDFPLTPDAVQTTSAGQEAFVTKLSASGSALDYSTYLGGNSSDFGFGIFVDGAGDAYVTGDTFSTNFPTTAGAAQQTNGGILDAFVTKIEFVKPLPTSKDQCKDGGWKAFGVFKNQGDCVSFVATNGKTGPGLP